MMFKFWRRKALLFSLPMKSSDRGCVKIVLGNCDGITDNGIISAGELKNLCCKIFSREGRLLGSTLSIYLIKCFAS